MILVREHQLADRNARIFQIQNLYRLEIFDAQDDYQSMLQTTDIALAETVAKQWVALGDRDAFEREAGRY